MGLLDKKNPQATAGSVLRHAFLVGLVGASLYLFAMLCDALNDSLQEHWVIGLCVWTCTCAFVGGLWEWQVDRGVDEDEDDS